MRTKLISERSGIEVKPGDTVTDFRGETAILKSGEPPLHEGKCGYVNVTEGDGGTGHYYASVFGLRFVDPAAPQWEIDAMTGRPMRYVSEDKYLVLLTAAKEYLDAEDALSTLRFNGGKRMRWTQESRTAHTDALRRRREAFIALDEIVNPKQEKPE